ncbi:DUF2752 domain-containing protein [Streptomyces sp. NPDC086787]|uniref:DUF2752 domain-containing protein n=1 Tax=Streptomyces sp. NPDC086787 TaxID=3365759 RepID=UPI0038078EDC
MRDVNPDSRTGPTIQRPRASAPAGPAVPAAILAVVAGAFAYVGAVDPNEPGHYPVCPLFRFAGLYCPGCGGLRSAHAFVHGDLAAAFRDNAMAVLGYLGFAVVWTLWVLAVVRRRPLRLVPGPAYLWGAGALVAVFTVVRNLPFGGWLHP